MSFVRKVILSEAPPNSRIILGGLRNPDKTILCVLYSKTYKSNNKIVRTDAFFSMKFWN